jgi:hypothetical protein
MPYIVKTDEGQYAPARKTQADAARDLAKANAEGMPGARIVQTKSERNAQ